MSASDELHRESVELWERKAAFWDERMGDGNRWYRQLVAPAAERLLNLRAGEAVLDVACGNGVFARRLVDLGARVTACDVSATFIERARSREPATCRIDYRVVDATDEVQLLSLGQASFDAAVCNMALHDISDIRPLARALPRLLKRDGRFAFTVPHPAFNFADGTKIALEEEDRNGELRQTYYVKISNYLRTQPVRGTGMIGEPAPHYDFHRPLGALLATFFEVGLVLDALEEPAFDSDEVAGAPLSWANIHDIPPVLAGRLRWAQA